MNGMCDRARALIVVDGRVALIERRNSTRGRHYYIFPGGGVEEGETPFEAVTREVQEELGLAIKVRRPIAEVLYDGENHQYFQAEIVGGTFGTGHGLEMTGQTPPESGSYKPVWIPTGDLLNLPVYPAAVARIINEVSVKGWPQTPLAFVDRGEL